MPPIEVGPARALSAIEARLARAAGGDGKVGTNSTVAAAKQEAKAATATSSAPAVQASGLDAGAAPVDTDRVAQIRKAVEQGTYPLVPTKIADAMIAAGVLLRSAHNG